MREIKMLDKKPRSKKPKSILANSSSWLRAPESGIIQTKKSLGKKVKKGEVVATLISAFGDEHQKIIADKAGIIIGASILPLVNKGDAVFHIASFDDVDHAHNVVNSYIIDDEVI
jgi:predicted deacylase